MNTSPAPLAIPHAETAEAVLAMLQVDSEIGLSQEEAQERINRFGFNELQEEPPPSLVQRVWDQLREFLVIILIVACVISVLVGELGDAAAILAIVILNTVIGVVQESRAENALRSLKKLASPEAQVLRAGHWQRLLGRTLVPGDIILIETGNYVAADIRLIDTSNLRVDESALTGESVPATKRSQAEVAPEAMTGERPNMAFMSTVVTYGRGKGVVVATGMQTAVGQIAQLLSGYKEVETPLQRRLDEMGKVLGIAALIVSAIVFGIGIYRQRDPLDMFLTAISLAIAAVPEGLPAIVTICLALGVQRMIKRHALVRNLPVIETLGSATVICSDKTGTLTQNQMTIDAVFADGRVFQVSGKGYDPAGEIRLEGEAIQGPDFPGLERLMQAAVLCNDALWEEHRSSAGEKATWSIVGDPTEGALLVAAGKLGLDRQALNATYPRLAEIPFDSTRKRMTTIHANPDGSGYVASVKGATELVLELSDRIYTGRQVMALSGAQREEILRLNRLWASQALRILAFAYRPISEVPDEPDAASLESDLIFLGLAAMRDPAREEVKAAIAIAQAAGLQTVMITGDNRETALAIAKELQLVIDDQGVMTGSELERMGDEELARRVDQVKVFARVSPEHKLRIVEALQANPDHVIAMTGDGVNDAPALKRAHIGVAMGITGTDVAKEMADMVLTDDNYASIVAAIEEGRVIYANIRKFVFFLLSCNAGEVLIVLAATIAFGFPLLHPIQLLWLNLVTDGLPAVALGVETGDPDIMTRPPRPVREPIINRRMWILIGIQAIVDASATLGVYGMALMAGEPAIVAETMAFTTLVCAELVRAYTSRSEFHSVFTIGVFKNRFMVLATGISLLLLLVVMYVPFLQPLFYTFPLSLRDWLKILPFIFLPAVGAEVAKLVLRHLLPRDDDKRNHAAAC
ncbi:MAG: cation-translocating P-type ATPase [Chloroflexi bacterium]|nr:cation-translocating P-type ATPase [Chloroflexota bacterium]